MFIHAFFYFNRLAPRMYVLIAYLKSAFRGFFRHLFWILKAIKIKGGKNISIQYPLIVEGKGDNKTFKLLLRGPSGQMDEKRFVVFRDKNRLRVTPPEDIGQYQTKSK